MLLALLHPLYSLPFLFFSLLSILFLSFSFSFFCLLSFFPFSFSSVSSCLPFFLPVLSSVPVPLLLWAYVPNVKAIIDATLQKVSHQLNAAFLQNRYDRLLPLSYQCDIFGMVLYHRHKFWNALSVLDALDHGLNLL